MQRHVSKIEPKTGPIIVRTPTRYQKEICQIRSFSFEIPSFFVLVFLVVDRNGPDTKSAGFYKFSVNFLTFHLGRSASTRLESIA